MAAVRRPLRLLVGGQYPVWCPVAAVRRPGHDTGVGGQGRARAGGAALSQPITVVSLFHRCGEKVQKFEALQHLPTSNLRTTMSIYLYAPFWLVVHVYDRVPLLAS